MPQIIQLEQHVADLIAAGEVVSRPASVVKELVENSIDAGAGMITVEITSGGMAYIRITDDGCGIAREDVKTAFLRHATSKLRDASGLEAIETLGFRGEALAAIAAVSRAEILTRTADSDIATHLTLTAGVPSQPVDAGAPAGTTIIIRDLFFNTPARLKFLKTDRAEGSAVSSVVLRCALSRPDISFRYIKDGKSEYHTPGDSNPESCIYSLLGREFFAGLAPAGLTDGSVSVKGFVSAPEASRGNRGYQFFFINGRTVRSVLLQTALEQAYSNMNRSGRFPSCVLYITAGFGSVDVNVHPAKTEVRFISDKQVFDAVYYAALGALEKSSMPVSSADNILPESLPNYAVPDKMPGASVFSVREKPAGRYTPEPNSYQNTGGFKNPAYISTAVNTPVSQPLLQHVPAFRVIGEALRTYIIIEYQDTVWFIDKHAVHERIHYDALAGSEYEPMSEALITPVICRTGCRGASLLLDNQAVLGTLGFSVESFGEDAVAVRYMPSCIHQRDVEPVLAQICSLLESSTASGTRNLDSIYKIIACKAAVKAGSSTSMQEMEALAAKVVSGQVTHCPHGRPVAFEISKNVIEKNFGRI